MLQQAYCIIGSRARAAAILLLLAIAVQAVADEAPLAKTEVTDDKPLPPVSHKAPKREMRAVWITTLSGLDWPKIRAIDASSRERQKQEFRDILDCLKAANINTILLQTRVRASTIYPSAIEPWDVALTGKHGGDPGYDPLAFAIGEAHRRGMELHAWVVTIPCFKVAVAKQMGSASLLRKHPELLVRHGDTYYLDPGLPATADYLVNVCHEIVSRYDVDGIHFDYIRYPEQAATFNDASTFKRYGNGRNRASWRRDNITAIVRRIHDDVRRTKPWVCVSSSPVGKYADLDRYSSRGWNARDAVHQDAEGWLSEGIHDMLFPMMYFDGAHFYPFAADWQEQSHGRGVALGLGVYLLDRRERDWPLAAIVRQLNFTRSEGLAGQCYFRSRFLTDNTKGVLDFLRNDFYAFPALTPARTWLSDTIPSPPEQVSMEVLDDGIAALRWQWQAGMRYNVYASRQWPVATDCAENLVATALDEPRYVFNRLYAALSGYNLAVTALDRYGNESAPVQVAPYESTPTPPWHLDITRPPYLFRQ